MDEGRVFRCGYLLPITSGCIEGAGLVVSESSVIDFGEYHRIRREYPYLPVTDYSEYLVLPGFVNAHAHLELGSLQGRISAGLAFVDWIHALIPLKRQLTVPAILKSVEDGVRALWESGVVALADVSSEYLSWRYLGGSALYSRVFFEYLPVRDEDVEPALCRVDGVVEEVLCEFPESALGLSPHAPYTLSPKALRAFAGYNLKRRLPVSIHVAESCDEWDMFRYGCGDLLDFMRQFRSWNLPTYSPVGYLQHYGALEDRILLVHANLLASEDFPVLQNTRACVVHCPLSHAYFGHPPFPLPQLLEHGIPVALGTDSLASNTVLDFFQELRQVRAVFPEVSAETIVCMATVYGARALRLPYGFGEVTKKGGYSLIALKVDGSLVDPYEWVVGCSQKPVHICSQYPRRVFL